MIPRGNRMPVSSWIQYIKHPKNTARILQTHKKNIAYRVKPKVIKLHGSLFGHSITIEPHDSDIKVDGTDCNLCIRSLDWKRNTREPSRTSLE